MSEERDLEALQKRLDHAFASTRPRRGFEDELWSRMQARRSFRVRLRERVRSVRLAPALGALAVVAVVVVFGGLLLSRPHPAGESTSSTVAQPAARNGAGSADHCQHQPARRYLQR